MKPTSRTSAQRPPLTPNPALVSLPHNHFSIEDQPLPGEDDQDFLPLIAHSLPAGRPEPLGRPRW